MRFTLLKTMFKRIKGRTFLSGICFVILVIQFLSNILFQNNCDIHIQQVKKIFVKEKDFVIMTFGNYAEVPFIKHFICNLEKLKVKKSLMVVATDEAGISSLKTFQNNHKYYSPRVYVDKLNLKKYLVGFYHCLL